jgi:hypothetical protein
MRRGRYRRLADFRAGRLAGFFPAAALRAAGRFPAAFLAVLPGALPAVFLAAADFRAERLEAAGRFFAFAAAFLAGLDGLAAAVRTEEARLAGRLRGADRLVAAARLPGADSSAGALAAAAFLAGSWTANAPPCGSRIWATRLPPGTSIGPWVTRPPAAFTAAAARSTLPT